MTTETLTRPAPVEKVTPIKPSEAIRLGCLTTAPYDGALFGPRGETCAVGAGLVGWFGSGAWDHGYYEFDKHARGRNLTCPMPQCAAKNDEPASEVVYHLNDTHEWSRERIADWLAEQGL